VRAITPDGSPAEAPQIQGNRQAYAKNMDDEPISIIFAEEGYFVALDTSTILFMKK
jgi:hypothetical protein